MAQRYLERDLGWREIKKGLKQLDGQCVDTGLFAEDLYPDRPERDAAQVAFWNEYGTEDGHVPARPFNRECFERNRNWVNDLFDKGVDQLYRRYDTALEVLENIGLAYREMLKYVLLEGPWVPNAPRTVAKKGHAMPLIDTEFLWSVIKYKLRKRGAAE